MGLSLPAISAPAPARDAFPTAKAPYMGAYRWSIGENGGINGNIAFAKWGGKKAVWAEDFTPGERWGNNIEGGSWQVGPWGEWKKADPDNRRLIYSVGLLPGGWDRSGPKDGDGAGQPVSLEAGAKGEYNEHFRKLADNLINAGLGDSVLRLGWEFNGGWYTWRANENPAAFAGYWREIVKTMRAVKGAKFRYCWNPAMGWLQFTAESAWPGDEWVDYVGLDVYDDSWQADTYPFPAGTPATEILARQKKVWNEVILNGNHGLGFWRDFAKIHKKPLAIPEWGISKREDTHGGLDNPYFIEQMHKFIADKANNVYFHCYFDVQAGDGHHQLSPGVKTNEKTEFPNASAIFLKLFGSRK